MVKTIVTTSVVRELKDPTIITKMELTIPYPPTIYTHWQKTGYRTFVTKAGHAFRLAVDKKVQLKYANCAFDPEAKLSFSMVAYLPDKRKRDLDNILKALFDSLVVSGILPDDSQIWEFSKITKVYDPKKKGTAEVSLTVIS